MGFISEQQFEKRDNKHKDYSLVEYDLYARLGLTIVKNHALDRFEIITIRGREVKYHGNIHQIARIANELEGADNTQVK